MGAKARRNAEKPDLRNQAAYGLADAARYLKLPAPLGQFVFCSTITPDAVLEIGTW